MMNRKIIFLDIDGTLTQAGCNVPPDSALKAIKKAQENGHYVFLCTGRNYYMMKSLMKYGFDGAVASAGGYVFYMDHGRKQVIADHPMTRQQSDYLIEVLQKNDVNCSVECVDGTYREARLKEFLLSHIDEGGNSEYLRMVKQLESNLGMIPFEKYDGAPVYKVVIACPSKAQLEEPKLLLEEDYHMVIQGMNKYGVVNGEVTAKGFDKGTGVREACDYLGVAVEDTIGFGDSMNDIEMLETTGISICMASGAEEVKALSDDICPCVSEDGIWHAFKKYNLI